MGRQMSLVLTDPMQAKKATKIRLRVSSSRIAFLLPNFMLGFDMLADDDGCWIRDKVGSVVS